MMHKDFVEVEFKPDEAEWAAGQEGWDNKDWDQGWNDQSPDDEETGRVFPNNRKVVDLDEVDGSDLLTLSTNSGDSEEDNLPFYHFDASGKVESSKILKNDVHNIPGSPWAKPRARHSRRPTEPLGIASLASLLGLLLAIGGVVYLFVVAVWSNSSLGRIIVEVFLSILTFFGLFWNAYFTVSSICKCFIPSEAFKKNGKYVSFIPEQKYPDDDWLQVTIQIPVYKESLAEVLGPTLKSCMAARDHYQQHTGAVCNIVVCDDGLMAFLRDNFSAAEMLWENVHETRGRITNINDFLRRVPRIGRRHLRGLRSANILEVFHRMLFYYHNNIGFVSRSTLDRRGKFKKASNVNTHLRLVFGAQQMAEETNMKFNDALLKVAHNDDGSRDVMFGNDITIGDLILVNDADARMQPPVIMKTVPEFLNDKKLGFTQHATKTMDDQRGESYFLRMVEVYTDALYQGHFLLSSIMGCHPPLVGHSIFLRTEAVRQCGRMRMLRKAQRWLDNIGLPFVGVDQLGFGNVQSETRTEYWSENHVSEDFELMIHLYNIGYTGRYVAFPDCEFQEGVTRTFDEEAGRHRKFSLGAHELMFNPFQELFAHGLHSSLYKTFLNCDMPSYYKIFLTAYLHSYTAGGVYILVFVLAAIARLVDDTSEIGSLYEFSPAGVIILSLVLYYVIGYTTFLIALVRMHINNKNLFFPEYRKHGVLYLIYKKVRYSMLFQFLFYTIMGNYFFLGGMDHMISRSRIVGATNKDSINIPRCTALMDTARFNNGAWSVAIGMAVLAVATVLKDADWDFERIISGGYIPGNRPLLFAGPPIVMGLMAILVPIILNPYIFRLCGRQETKKPEEIKNVLSSNSAQRKNVRSGTPRTTPSSSPREEISGVNPRKEVRIANTQSKNPRQEKRSTSNPRQERRSTSNPRQETRSTSNPRQETRSVSNPRQERRPSKAAI